MLNTDPVHSFAMQALPSAVGNLIAYVLGWGPWRGPRARHALAAPSDAIDDDDGSAKDDDDWSAETARTAQRSRDAVGRSALYRSLRRGPLVDADRILARATTTDEFRALVVDPLALSSIVATDSVAAVMLLARHAARVGVDPCELFSDPSMCDVRAGGKSVLDAAGGDALVHLACATGSVAVLSAMLRMGVSPEHRCSTTRSLARASTPLHVAARAGSLACASVLLAVGAAPNATGADAMTPLHEAAAHGHTDVVRLLLVWGASTSLRRRTDAATAVGVANHAGHPLVAAAITAVADVRHYASVA
jgi:hypothetical protein